MLTTLRPEGVLPSSLIRRATLIALLIAGAGSGAPPAAAAQTLRGSQASVDRAYRFAVSNRIPFRRSRRSVDQAARGGQYVRLASGANYRLRGVGIPYLLPTTRAVLGDLAARYRRACGERLVVTSAIRLSSRRLVNSSRKSVHPTGLAFDMRKPRGRCRTWLRSTLLSLERRGVLDATEERFPPHVHVVVYRAP